MLIGSFGEERKGFLFFLELSLKVVSSTRAGLCARKAGADQYCGKHESAHQPARRVSLAPSRNVKTWGERGTMMREIAHWLPPASFLSTFSRFLVRTKPVVSED